MMRAVDASAQALRETGVFAERILMWIEARDRDNPEVIHGLGVWTGGDAATITVTDIFTGQVANRVFYGAGEMLGVESLRHTSGLEVRPVTVVCSNITPAIEQAVRLYDPRGQRAQLWRWALSAGNHQPVGAPEPWFMGYVDTAVQVRPVPGGEATLPIELVSTARLLTIPSPRRKSDAVQRRRNGDRFRRYKGAAHAWDVGWGEE